MCSPANHSNQVFPTYLYGMPNRLINEQSPYLLQHANNPVDWYPWGDEAFEKAKSENKPVIVSIGYSACHWCHVMERESFENEEVAEFMNRYFVCIKVDREEHPDVDHMYMDAVQAIGGSGGWPLNVFVTPERAPFYGGTYFPPRPAFNRPSWMQLLHRMVEIWHQQQDEVVLQTSQILDYLKNASQKTGDIITALPSKDITRRIAESLLKQADVERGGFGNAPKFPATMAISYLLEHYHFTGHEPSLKHALRSLDAMIDGGIYDQLGGGFARYATDRDWLIPHFEKMLYDNALLVSSLCDAYSITKDVRYKKIVQETIAFVERELKDDSGGYYCALDADSEGEEGKYYTWTWDEWKEALDGSSDIAEMFFGVSKEGNWEGTNILHISRSTKEIAAERNLPEAAVAAEIDNVKNKLYEHRKIRTRPLTDDKSLLSWNALMNASLTRAGVVMQNEEYLRLATAHMQWMIAAFEVDGIMKHTWKKGVARIAAKLDDLAYLVQAMLQLASATGENGLVVTANRLMQYAEREFSSGSLMFYYTSERDADIPVRKVDTYDGATPSANAVMVQNLWLCGMCMDNQEWIARSERMVANMGDIIERYSYSFGYWAIMLQRFLEGPKTVVYAGSQANAIRRQASQSFVPQAHFVTSNEKIYELPVFKNKYFEDKIHIFVCSGQACLSPVSTVNEAIDLVNK